MKRRISFIVMMSGIALVIPSGESHALFGIFKKETPAVNANAQVGAPKRLNIVKRGFRAFSKGFVPACNSQNGGRLDGFRRCLASYVSSGMSIDKRTSVLALDSQGIPLTGNVSRVRFQQEWFQRQWTLNKLSGALLAGLNQVQQDLATLEAQNNQGAKNQKQQQGFAAKQKLLEELEQDYTAQFTETWEQFQALEEEIKQTGGSDPFYTAPGETPCAPVPLPQAEDPVFTPSTSASSFYMSSDFSAAVNNFAVQNPSLVANFCHNFFSVGKDAGYEADYVRMSDVGPVNQRGVDAYQNTKLAMISAKCSENSLVGLWWRKIFSVCGLEVKSQQIQACSGWSDDNEVRDTQYNP